jgi:tetratricopeptide (TPR) repeat protein
MELQSVRAFLDEIITMPDAGQATALAVSNRTILLSPSAYRTLEDMIREAAAPADARRHRALLSLRALRVELFGRTVAGRDLTTPPLPEVEVAPDPGRDRFAYWLDRIDVAGSGTEPARISPTPALAVMDLQRRHLALLPRTMVGRADIALLEELRGVLAGYEQILAAGPPDDALVSEADLLRRCAEVHDSMARTAEVLDRRQEAVRHHEQSALLHSRAGDEHEAAEAERRRARLGSEEAGDVDAEVIRLQAAIDAGTGPSVQAVQHVIELAELHQRTGNDFDAIPLLQRAERELAELGYPDPAGPRPRDLAQALTGFVQHAGSADLGERSARLLEVILVRNLYSRIYAAWIQLHQARGHVEQAERYLRLATALDDPDANTEFSRLVSAALPELFGSADPP